MTIREFKVWFPGEDETEDGASLVLGVDDAEDAAIHACESGRCGPDYYNDIDGDPVRVMVSEVLTGGTPGRRWCFEVQAWSSINYSADEVDA